MCMDIYGNMRHCDLVVAYRTLSEVKWQSHINTINITIKHTLDALHGDYPRRIHNVNSN
jgi:hypothetical protein